MTTEDKTQEELRRIVIAIGSDDNAKFHPNGYVKKIEAVTAADRKVQASKLLDAIEERGPENITGFESDRYEIGVEDGFDRSNKEWRSLLKELRKEL
jgi:hypothetical protein